MKERADAVKERRGDLTRMIEQGLETVVKERERQRHFNQSAYNEQATPSDNQATETGLSGKFNY